MSDGDNPLLHTKIDLAQGGAIGVKDMLFDGVKRLAVRTPGGGPLGSAYLRFDECVKLAQALFANRVPAETVALVVTLPKHVYEWLAESYSEHGEPDDVVRETIVSWHDGEAQAERNI
jgi:hypothetical protein